MIPNNARSLRLTAAAGTKLAGASLHSNVRQSAIYTQLFTLRERTLQPEGLRRHAASHRQAFAHCGLFSTAASRRSLGSVSVPVWPDTLSGRLPIVTLVGHYPTNKLIGRRPLLERQARRSPPFTEDAAASKVVSGISSPFELLSRSRGRLSTHYSPFRHFTRFPKETSSCDLHA